MPIAETGASISQSRDVNYSKGTFANYIITHTCLTYFSNKVQKTSANKLIIGFRAFFSVSRIKIQLTTTAQTVKICISLNKQAAAGY